MGLQIGYGADYHFMGNIPLVLDEESDSFSRFHLNLAGREPHAVIHRHLDGAGDFGRIARLAYWRRRVRHGGHIVTRHAVRGHRVPISVVTRIQCESGEGAHNQTRKGPFQKEYYPITEKRRERKEFPYVKI